VSAGAGRPVIPVAVTPVAVGVLIRADGAVLLADRPPGKPYAGYWEFPGGKVEPGESVEQALARELDEELGVSVTSSDPWTVIEHDYPHAYVRLYVRRVEQWLGAPHAAEGQRLCFLQPGAPAPAPLLPATVPILRWLALPTVLVRTPGVADDAAAAIAGVEDALARGARLILWHEPLLPVPELQAALAHCAARARSFGARMSVDERDRQRLPAPTGASAAVAEASAALADASAAVADPEPLGAVVRERADLQRAAQRACDFAVIEEAALPAIGADVRAIGDEVPEAAWTVIEALCADAPLPVYVPLPPSAGTLARARSCGAHGLILRL
jgi:8-oxo-dGTP diphosphatase